MGPVGSSLFRVTRIRIRILKTGSADPDPDPEKNGPDPQHYWFLVANVTTPRCKILTNQRPGFIRS